MTQAGKEYDFVVWNEGTQAGVQTKKIVRKYQDLKEMKGKIIYLYLTTKKVDTQGNTTETDQVVTKIETGCSEDDCYQNLRQVRDFMIKNGRKCVALYPPGFDNRGDILRKMAECVFVNTEIKCCVYYSRGRREAGGRDRDTDAVIVSREGQTYADLLRAVKDGIKDENKDVMDNIRTIRQMKDGNMLIAMKSDQKKTEEMKNILTKLGDISARVIDGKKGRGTILHIRGMDAITTKKEVEAAIEKEARGSEGPLRVGELRPFFGSSQAVTVTVPEKVAETLLTSGEIRIGYSWCKVTERVNVIQCYRCWNYGHMAAECVDDTDRSKSCRNCGEMGHLRKECNKEKRCPLCRKVGHCAGTGGCPKTREALREARDAGSRATRNPTLENKQQTNKQT